MSGVINTPESLPRRRLHFREDESDDDEKGQEANGRITPREREQQVSDRSKDGKPQLFETPTPQPAEPTNPIAWLAPIFHLAMVVFYTLLIYHGFTFLNDNLGIIDPEGRIPAYGGLLKFLTNINQCVQLFYFSVQFATDVLPKSHFKRIATKYTDIIFTTIAFPLSWFIVLAFWGNYYYDKEGLIYPPLDNIPVWYNHFWHTTVGVFVLFEMMLVFHRFPRTSFAAALCFTYFAAYIAWITWIHQQTNFWVYPIVATQSAPSRLLLFSCSIFFNFGVFYLGKFVSHLRWGPSTVY